MQRPNGLTEAQQQTINKAFEILAEHLDTVIIVYDTECIDGTDHVFEAFYKGGITNSVGLLERAKIGLLRPDHPGIIDPEES